MYFAFSTEQTPGVEALTSHTKAVRVLLNFRLVCTASAQSVLTVFRRAVPSSDAAATGPDEKAHLNYKVAPFASARVPGNRT